MKISAAFLFPYFFLAGGLYSPGKNNRETKIAEKNICSPEKKFVVIFISVLTKQDKMLDVMFDEALKIASSSQLAIDDFCSVDFHISCFS